MEPCRTLEEGAPAPTAHYRLLPNENNLCAGRGAQTVSRKLKGEENSGEAEGGICPPGEQHIQTDLQPEI